MGPHLDLVDGVVLTLDRFFVGTNDDGLDFGKAYGSYEARVLRPLGHYAGQIFCDFFANHL